MNIWWVRRDLRLADNQALTAALQEGSGVLPVYILDDLLWARPAEMRHGFLIAGLRALDEDLRRLGSRLIVCRGDSLVELPRLAVECGAQTLFAEADVSPYAQHRDDELGQRLDLRLVHGVGVYPPSAVVRPDGKPYTVFTPFSRAWQSLPFNARPLPAPSALPPVPDIPVVLFPELPAPASFPSGERAAQNRLALFLDGPIFDYDGLRDRLDLDGTSALSPYLRFGMLSARQAAAGARKAAHQAMDAPARAGCERWLNELIWREFYQSILYHFPTVLKESFKPAARAIAWRSAPEDLRAWQVGLTGYPVVDAGMRQLAATGWMHNRARMITASFLVKHLLINWQAGERWFMRMLIDGDPAANNGGWQWVAGTGTDAAPYFRIFNPILQGQKYDPEGSYVRRWVPELANVPTRYIHAPWTMPVSEQRALNVIIGSHYPLPIVDHDYARQRVLATYRTARA